MSALKQAAQQALEELRKYRRHLNLHGQSDVERALEAALTEDALQRFTDVNQEIEAALAEPVQEPVAWRYSVQPQVLGASYWAFSDTKDVPDAQPLYAAPPQRKPLTEEEIQAAWNSVDMRHPRGNETRIAFARAIERAHGIGDQP